LFFSVGFEYNGVIPTVNQRTNPIMPSGLRCQRIMSVGALNESKD
jgi:hypothetical protein